MKASIADYNAFVARLREQEAKWGIGQLTPRSLSGDLMRASQINEVIHAVESLRNTSGVGGSLPSYKTPEVTPIDNNDFDIMMSILNASAAKCKCNCDDCHCRGRHIKSANRFKRFNWNNVIKVLEWIKNEK